MTLAFTEDPRDLVDPGGLVDPLTLREQEFTTSIRERDTAGDLVKAAAAIGAAFYAYRWYMRRRIAKELEGTQPSASALERAVENAYGSYQLVWLETVLPHLISGYASGLIDVQHGTIPDQVLYEIARGYAWNLGEHVNEISAQSVVSGYQAQLNRKVPPARALQRVLDAYGVPPRTMNSLVNVWTSEEPKITSDVVPIDHRLARARIIIDHGIELRARMIGDNEVWSAREQAKQMVWLYGVQTGNIPADATRSWRTADDERVCPVCGPMNGASVLVTEQFKVSGHGSLWAPPVHPACRCDLSLDVEWGGDWGEVVKSRADDPEHVKRNAAGQYATVEALPEQRRESRGVTFPPKMVQLLSQRPTSVGEAVERLDVIERLAVLDLSPEQGQLLLAAADGALSYIGEQESAREVVAAPLRDVRSSSAPLREVRSAPLRDVATRKDTAPLKDVAAAPLQDVAAAPLRDVGAEAAPLADTREKSKLDQVAEADLRGATKVQGRSPYLFRLEHSTFAYIDPRQVWRDKNRLGREVVDSDQTNKWFTFEGRSRDAAGQVLRHRVNEHWVDVEKHQLRSLFEEARTQDHPGYAVMEDYDMEGGVLLVDWQSFLGAWRWMLAGEDKDRDDDLNLEIMGAHGVAYPFEASHSDIVEMFEMRNLLEDTTPLIATTDYVDVSAQEYEWSREGFAMIAGRWKVTEDLQVTVPGVVLPHKVVHVLPEHMDE